MSMICLWCVLSYLESPRLSGRVVAGLMAQSRHDLLTKRSGTIQVRHHSNTYIHVTHGLLVLQPPRISSPLSSASLTAYFLPVPPSPCVQIVAEVARELSLCDPVSGLQPPSIRSLQFLLPNFIWPKAAPSALPFPQTLKALLPDWKLPLTLMSQRPQ